MLLFSHKKTLRSGAKPCNLRALSLHIAAASRFWNPP